MHDLFVNAFLKKKMGAAICGFGQTSPKRLHKQDSNDQQVELTASIMEFMRPRCLCRSKKKKKQTMQLKNQQEKQQKILLNKVSQLTLEELLSASPRLNHGSCNNGGDFYVLKQFSNRVYPSLPREKEEDLVTSKSKESFSMERQARVSEVERDEVEDSSLRRSQSGKIRKKVSFREPKLADIIIYDSHI